MDPTTLPAAAPPPGVVPNFANPDSWSDVSLGLMSALIAVNVIGAAIRVFTKLRIMHRFDHEDCSLLYTYPEDHRADATRFTSHSPGQLMVSLTARIWLT